MIVNHAKNSQLAGWARIQLQSKRGKAILSNKPDHCAMCKTNCRKLGIKLYAHHEDYAQPFILTWVCARCHMTLHRADPAEFAERFHANRVLHEAKYLAELMLLERWLDSDTERLDEHLGILRRMMNRPTELQATEGFIKFIKFEEECIRDARADIHETEEKIRKLKQGLPVYIFDSEYKAGQE